MGACDEILDLISARLDGELTAEQKTALAEHLSACPECSALARDLEGLHAAMPGLNVTPPAAIMENVMARIKEEAKVVSFPTKKKPSRQWRALGAAAAIFAVVLAGTFALRGGMNNGASGGDAVTLDVPPPAAAPSSAPSASLAEASPRSVQTEEEHEYGVMPSMEDAAVESGTEYRGEASFTQKDTAPAPSPTGAADAGGSAATGGVEPRMAQTTSGVTASPPQVPTTFSSQKVDAKLYGSFSGKLTAQSACETLFEHLKEQNYPDLGTAAPWEGAILTGTAETDDLVYTLAAVAAEGETYTWRLAYVGLSQNRKYHEFHLYAEVTDGTATRTVQGGWYGVAVADGTILTAQDDIDAYETAVSEE